MTKPEELKADWLAALDAALDAEATYVATRDTYGAAYAAYAAELKKMKG